MSAEKEEPLTIDSKRFFNLGEVAQLASVARGTVSKWADKGKFTVIPSENSDEILVEASELQRFLEDRKKGSKGAKIAKKNQERGHKPLVETTKGATIPEIRQKLSEQSYELELAKKDIEHLKAQKSALETTISDKNNVIENQTEQINHLQEQANSFRLLEDKREDNIKSTQNTLTDLVDKTLSKVTENQSKEPSITPDQISEIIESKLSSYEDKRAEEIRNDKEREEEIKAKEASEKEKAHKDSVGRVGGLVAAAVFGIAITAGIFFAIDHISLSGASNDVANINPAAGIETPVEAPTAQINAIPDSVVIDPFNPEGQQSLAPEFRE